jgi:hypothetical protein
LTVARYRSVKLAEALDIEAVAEVMIEWLSGLFAACCG